VEGDQTEDSLTRAVDYALGKLTREAPASSALTVRAFYRTGSVDVKDLSNAISTVRCGLQVDLGTTLVPVVALHDENTVLSLCGLRFQ
jgi:hypothetical protein